MASEVLREYLVDLGFRVDESSLKKWGAALGGTGKLVFEFAAIVTAAAAATTVFVDKMTKGMEDLYWASQRLYSSVGSIKSYELAIEKMGGTAEGARASLEGMARMIRTNPATESFIRMLGVQTRKADGGMRGMVDVMRDLGEQFRHMPYWLAAKWAERLGIDEGTLYAMTRGLGRFGDKYGQLFKQLGIDPDKAAKGAHEFQNRLRDLGAEFNVFATVLAADLLPVVNKIIEGVEFLMTQILRFDGVLRSLNWKDEFRAWEGPLTDIWKTIKSIIDLVVSTKDMFPDGFFSSKQMLQDFRGMRDAALAIVTYFAAIADFLRGDFSGGSKRLKKFWTLANSTGEEPIPLEGKAKQKSFGTSNGSPTKSVAAAVSFFQKAGWTANQAAGIVANLFRESKLKANATGDSGQSFGIAQWHGDRQAAFKKWSGHDIRQSTVGEQLAFVNYELTRGAERAAGRLLKGAGSAVQAGQIVSRFYERPRFADAEASMRGALASRLGATRGGATNVTINQKTNISVNGSGNPKEAANHVLDGQARTNGDLVRNTKTAVM